LPEPETQFVHGLFDVVSVNKAWRNAALGCGQLGRASAPRKSEIGGWCTFS
jgi:hypothetical protein